MLIFHDLSVGNIALGAFVAAVGLALGLSYGAAIREPPESLEEEQSRIRMGNMAATLGIVGVLMCGVGVLFM